MVFAFRSFSVFVRQARDVLLDNFTRLLMASCFVSVLRKSWSNQGGSLNLLGPTYRMMQLAMTTKPCIAH